MAIPRFSILKLLQNFSFLGEFSPLPYKFHEKKAFVNIYLSYEREL